MQDQPTAKTDRPRRSSLLWGALAVALIALIATGGVTLARYVMQWNDNRVAEAANFRFESDYLTDDNEPPSYTVYTGAASFTLKNNDGVNVTGEDVTYNVTTSGGTLSASSGTLTGGGKNSATITLTGTQGQSYTVTAAATAPYAKSLTATFKFANANDATIYGTNNFDDYIVLHIYTGNTGGNITVEYPNTLAPDNTNTYMASWTGSSGTLSNLRPNAHYEFIFFKNDVNYDADEIGQQLLSDNNKTINL